MLTLKEWIMLIAFALLMNLAVYVGITHNLCSRIDTFTAQEQESMQLDAKACAKPWYAKL